MFSLGFHFRPCFGGLLRPFLLQELPLFYMDAKVTVFFGSELLLS